MERVGHRIMPAIPPAANAEPLRQKARAAKAQRRMVTLATLPAGDLTAKTADMARVSRMASKRRRQEAVIADGPGAVRRLHGSAGAGPSRALAPGRDGAASGAGVSALADAAAEAAGTGAVGHELLAVGVAKRYRERHAVLLSPVVHDDLVEFAKQLPKYTRADGRNPLASIDAVVSLTETEALGCYMWRPGGADSSLRVFVVGSRPVGMRTQQGDHAWFGAYRVSIAVEDTAGPRVDGHSGGGGGRVVGSVSFGRSSRYIASARLAHRAAVQVARDTAVLMRWRSGGAHDAVHLLTVHLLHDIRPGDVRAHGDPIQYIVLATVHMCAAVQCELSMERTPSGRCPAADAAGFCLGRLALLLFDAPSAKDSMWKAMRVAALTVMCLGGDVHTEHFSGGLERALRSKSAAVVAEVTAKLDFKRHGDLMPIVVVAGLFPGVTAPSTAEALRDLVAHPTEVRLLDRPCAPAATHPALGAAEVADGDDESGGGGGLRGLPGVLDDTSDEDAAAPTQMAAVAVPAMSTLGGDALALVRATSLCHT